MEPCCISHAVADAKGEDVEVNSGSDTVGHAGSLSLPPDLPRSDGIFGFSAKVSFSRKGALDDQRSGPRGRRAIHWGTPPNTHTLQNDMAVPVMLFVPNLIGAAQQSSRHRRTYFPTPLRPCLRAL